MYKTAFTNLYNISLNIDKYIRYMYVKVGGPQIFPNNILTLKIIHFSFTELRRFDWLYM